MEIGTEQILSRPQAVPEQGLLHSGRTWILATGDLAALVVAYVVTYVASDWLGALPPVSAPGWFLVLARGCWRARSGSPSSPPTTCTKTTS